MNIEIAIDPYKIDKEQSSFIVLTKDDYVNTRLGIRSIAADDTALRVVIKNRGLIKWFKDLDGNISLRTVSPIEVLKTLLNCSDLPKILIQSPQKIVDLDLISLAHDNPIKPSQSSLEWILEVAIKFPWIRENLKEGGDVSQVLEWLVKYKNAYIDNVIVQLCIEKIKIWGDRSPFRELLEWLEPEPFERAYLFGLCQNLQDYPEFQKARWLQPEGQWSIFCQLPNYAKWVKEIPSIGRLDISPSLGVKIKDYIQEKVNQEGLTIGIAKELSGALKVEEDAIYRYLSSSYTNKSDLSAEAIKILEHKFKGGALKDILSNLNPVDNPPDIPNNLKIEEVIKWLGKCYYPFRAWCRTVDKEDLLDTPINNFEDWLINNYADLLASQPETFVCGVRKTVHSLIQEGASVLIVIIDGLAWQWKDYLIDSFKTNGFYLEREPEIRFSMLPSVSETSKPAIISGLSLSDSIKPPGLSLEFYNRLFKEAYGKYVSEYVVATDSTDTLLNLLREKSNVFLYLFNEVDGIAHEHSNNSLRDTNIKTSIAKLLLNIRCAVEEYERLHENGLKIVIVGDHGYLPIPKHFSKFSVDDTVLCHHGRVAEGIEIEGCYSLKQDGNIYAVAKGFNILGKKPRGCVHGGLTPDEVAVPLMILSTTPPAEPLKPSLVLDGEIKRHYPECQFTVEISNPNKYKLSLSAVEIDFVKLIDPLPIEILPSSTGRLIGILDATNIDDAEVVLRYQIKSCCLGQDNNKIGTITLKTKGAALADKSFEEEFDV